MKKKAANSIADLIEAVGLLKHLKRAGWLRKVGITGDRESVADHSFRVAILGLCLAEEKGLDRDKVTRMCLIHDLAESTLGDRMPEEKKSTAAHREEEDEVVRSLLAKIPSKSRALITADWEELLGSKSQEAKLVWEIDKLEMALQAIEYGLMGYDEESLEQFKKVNIGEDFRNMIETYRPKLFSAK